MATGESVHTFSFAKRNTLRWFFWQRALDFYRLFPRSPPQKKGKERKGGGEGKGGRRERKETLGANKKVLAGSLCFQCAQTGRAQLFSTLGDRCSLRRPEKCKKRPTIVQKRPIMCGLLSTCQPLPGSRLVVFRDFALWGLGLGLGFSVWVLGFRVYI